jgi:hypothetical protein
MQNETISRWVAAAGFAVLMAGLGLEGIAIYATYADGGSARSSTEGSSLERPHQIMRFLIRRSG